MNIYLAAAFERKEEIHGYATEIHHLGHTPTCEWVEDQTIQDGERLKTNPDEGRMMAMRDFHDIMESRMLIVFTGEPGRGGHLTEMGFALGLGIKVVVVGPIVNLFCLLSHAQYTTWEECRAAEFGVEGEKETDE